VKTGPPSHGTCAKVGGSPDVALNRATMPTAAEATVGRLREIRERSLEAAGVEFEIGDFSAVFQLFDGARVVVATRCCTDRWIDFVTPHPSSPSP
jgi:hypothetical protein